MGDVTGISWCDHTWNWVVGCTKVSAACRDCYMYRDMRRFGRDPTVVQRAATGTFTAPVHRDRAGAWKWPDGDLVFTCSWSDFFHADADPHRSDAWDLIRRRPGLRFLVLTKRPERIAGCLPPNWGDGWENVAFGVTAENQEAADGRVPTLLRVPARWRFVSAEPLLGPVHVPSGINWVIAGGESGPTARPADLAWYRSLLAQCRAAGVPYFQKQLHGLRPAAELHEFPEDLRVREFPAPWRRGGDRV